MNKYVRIDVGYAVCACLLVIGLALSLWTGISHRIYAEEMSGLSGRIETIEKRHEELVNELWKRRIIATTSQNWFIFLYQEPIDLPSLVNDNEMLYAYLGIEKVTTPAKTEFVKVKK